MSRIIPLLVALLVGPCFMSQAFAQLTPPAGTAGAGMTPINGIPYGPANPRSPTDLSGIGNAGSVPPLRPNNPMITTPQAPIATTRAAAPTYYPYASQRTISAHSVDPKGKTRHRRPGNRQVSSFTGICRGC
jgi:hypothetical protein